jgi:hypothetical protein
MSKVLTEEELGLILDRMGVTGQKFITGTIDSKHHSYTMKKRIKILSDLELNEEETEMAFEQFKKDLNEE